MGQPRLAGAPTPCAADLIPSPAEVTPERLERPEVVCFPACPFPLPDAPDQEFLRQQRLSGRAHKNISYNPHTGRVTGFARTGTAQADRLRGILMHFSACASQWLADTLPGYARAWRLDRASLRPEEEATRRLRPTARNDLLHLDAFPSRPTNGWRILRLYVNVNPTEPRVWVTSESFGPLLQRYGREVGLPGRAGWQEWLGRGMLGLFRPGLARYSPYDRFMVRFHHFLKANDDFQEKAPRRFWTFPPGSAWLVFGDGLTHAVLRGRWALEHSWFIAPESLALPDQAPVALLERACGAPVRNAA
jgi:hypothetical protein